MIDERLEEQAALHAFGLLEGPERVAFDAELARNAELRQRVAELRLAATGLAHSAPDAEPPAELRDRVLASAAATAARRPAPAKVTPFPTWIPWLAAAVFALAALGMGRRYAAAAKENERLRGDELAAVAAQEQAEHQLAEVRKSTVSQLEMTLGELAQAKQQVADAGRRVTALAQELQNQGDLAKLKITTLASMLGNSPAAVAVAVWDPRREEGVLAVSKMPAAAAEKDYQLWVIDQRHPAPVSAGTFVVDPVTGEAHVVFHAVEPVGAVAKFAVSLERKGGSPTPQGPIVMIGP